MNPRGDLFVVCKHCGAEVSPYVTECPYCGQRVRRRAPKIPRDGAASRASAGLRSRLAKGGRANGGGRPHGGTRVRSRPALFASATRPYATIAAVAVGCAGWIATRGGLVSFSKLAIIGPLHGDWWRLFTSQIAYANGLYALVALVTIALFGWLVEQRHGPAVTLALVLGAGVAGALATTAVYGLPVVSGANAPALALLCAWSAPDLVRARSGSYYEGDLLGAGALAAVLLVAPFALRELPILTSGGIALVPQASWLAGVSGGLLGALAGLGLGFASAEA